RGGGEVLEGEAGDFGHPVVDGRLEACWRGAPGDVVGELIECVADSELRRDLGDGKTGRLRRERRGTRYTTVHLDHDQPPGGGVQGELYIGPAGLHPDLAQHLD